MTEAPQELTETPLLQPALEQLRLEGAIFFRSELTEPFAFESTPLALADSLHPGAERLILFHIVASGSCWVSVTDGERYRASQGDVIVLPYADEYTIGGDAPAECVSILALVAPPPWDVMPVIRHGGGGARTDLVCGYLYSEDPLFDPGMQALPPVFVVRPPAGRVGELGTGQRRVFGRASCPVQREREPYLNPLARACADRGPSGAPVHGPSGRSRMDRSAARSRTGAGVVAPPWRARPQLDGGRARGRRRPCRDRSSTSVSGGSWGGHRSAISRSGGCTWPRRSWPRPTSAWPRIARRVGYRSEEAFSRAFKRGHAISPSHWRLERGL